MVARAKAVAKGKYWWDAEEGQAYQAVNDLLRHCEQSQGYRTEEILRFERMYGGRSMAGLTPFKYASNENSITVDAGRLKMNVTRAAIDALAAEIAQHKPRPLYLTKKGSTKLQKRAKQRTKYCEGQFYKCRVYETMQLCAFDAFRIGTGAAKISNDGHRLTLERVHPGELHVIDAETIYGTTRQLTQVKWIARSEVLQLPSVRGDEEKEALVEQCTTLSATSDMIQVRETWRLPIKAGKKTLMKGRHVITIDNGDLFDEEWKRERLPFAFYRYQRRPFGFWGSGVCELLMSIQFEINKLLGIIQEAFAFCSAPWVLTSNGAPNNKIDVAHLRNQVGAIIDGGIGQVQVYTPQPVHQSLLSQVELLYGRAFEEIGISRMAAQQTNELGANASGAAQRELHDRYSRRFMLQHQAFDQFALDISDIIVDESADLAAQHDGKLPVEVPVGDGVEIVDWADVADGEEMVLQCYPTNFFSTTPSAKKQEVIEALQAGWLSREQAMKQLDFPDVSDETGLITAFQDAVDRCARLITDEDTTVAKVKRTRGFWPEPFDDLGLCIDRMNRHLKRAQAADDLDVERLDLMREWINRAQALQLKKNPPAPPAAPPAEQPPADATMAA